jgi:hypothetical protein
MLGVELDIQVKITFSKVDNQLYFVPDEQCAA